MAAAARAAAAVCAPRAAPARAPAAAVRHGSHFAAARSRAPLARAAAAHSAPGGSSGAARWLLRTRFGEAVRRRHRGVSVGVLLPAACVGAVLAASARSLLPAAA